MKTAFFTRTVLLIGVCLLQSAGVRSFGADLEENEKAGWQPVLVAQGISHPWGMAWLPDGRLLVTSRNGSLHRLETDHFESIPLEGLPTPFVRGQGGVLDIALHPQDQSGDVRVYMTMSRGSESENRTILVRGVYDGTRVSNFRTLFRAQPGKSQAQHFGSRLLFLPDNTLLMSVGDGGNPPLKIGGKLARRQAQNRATDLGKIIRLTDNGEVPPDNPFVGQNGTRPEIWTLGHRNIQGLALDATGRVWATEHGPKGGDELNRIIGGKNYGWPLQSYGLDYRTDEPVGQPVVPGMRRPRTHWTPSIAPSGLTMYTGDDFPRWKGNLFLGGMVSQDIRRLVLDEKGKVIAEKSLPIGTRVRDVRQGPDGKLYFLTDEDNGKLYRLDPL